MAGSSFEVGLKSARTEVLRHGGARKDARAFPRDSEQPIEFGKYRLIRRLATGGMAQIYLASTLADDGSVRSCVIKMVLPDLANSADFNHMFATEAKIAGLLNHPNVVQVSDFGQVGETHYIAMEYVDGPSLQELIRLAGSSALILGPRAAVDVGLPLCDALLYVHGLLGPDRQPLRLVHRDVTPGNILITSGGEVKLTDFGIVKTSLNGSSFTMVGTIKGKYPYMSPEQLLGTPLDERSDLFSLGVVLYEVATGHSPFKLRSAAEAMDAITRGAYPPPSDMVPNFPPMLERILARALAPFVDQRYASAAEMRADLEEFRASQGWPRDPKEMAARVDALMKGRLPSRAVAPMLTIVDRPAQSRERKPPPPPAPVAAPARAAPPPSIQEDEYLGFLEWALLIAAAFLATVLFWLYWLT